MGTGRPHLQHYPPSAEGVAHARTTLVDFLTARLTEDLAAIWARGEAPGRPGVAAQVAAVDDLLLGLDQGRLPASPDLRWLLLGYGAHPAYDAAWTELLLP